MSNFYNTVSFGAAGAALPAVVVLVSAAYRTLECTSGDVQVCPRWRVDALRAPGGVRRSGARR
jgi:hypothetical protein